MGAELQINTDIGEVIWETKQIDIGQSLASYYMTNMQSKLGSSTGYGEAFFPHTAIRKSKYEAWERHHLIYVKDELPYLRQFTAGNSNGYACGTDQKNAKHRAYKELIERYVVRQAWSHRAGWESYWPTLIRTKLLKYVLSTSLWETQFFLIQLTFHKVLVAFAFNKANGAIFDSVYFENPESSEIKLALSLLKSMKIRDTKQFHKKEIDEHPDSHAAFYSDPKHLEAFDFLSSSESKRTLSLVINDQDIQYVCFQLSPKLPPAALAWNPKWPPMLWGKSSIDSRNKWPHPIS